VIRFAQNWGEVWAKVIRFWQNQDITFPKTPDLLLCLCKPLSHSNSQFLIIVTLSQSRCNRSIKRRTLTSV